MRERNKKIIRYSLIASVSLIIIFFVYFFYLFITVEGRIIEDKLFLGFVCEIRPLCWVGDSTTWPCEGIDLARKENHELVDPNSIELANWKGYQGCNKSTEGYIEIVKSTGRINKRITGVKSCSCKGLFG